VTPRAVLFALLFYPGTLVYVLSGIAVSLVGQRPMRAVVHGWSKYHYWLARHILGITTRVEGAIPSGPVLIASKHQSMFETIEMLRIAETPVVVMKRELAYMPLFGAIARRYGVISVDRDAGAKALREMLAAGRKAIVDGRPIVIFPEGTRVPVGTRPPLRPGFAGLYRALGLKVVPIALDSGRLWPTKRPGVVTFRVGEVIDIGLKRDDVEAQVHAAINALETSPA
jgi:1-acyl-sn-glycerol-3-phosphate acyltransferase